jgi:hypothetical protein
VSGGAAEGVAAEGARTERRPALSVLSYSPVVVGARGFRRLERVTLRLVVAESRYVRKIRAGRAGRFAVRFEQVSAECKPFVVTAVGAAGSRATTRRLAIPPPCGMVLQP